MQTSYKPKSNTALTDSPEKPFDGVTTHCLSFQKWKAGRLESLNETPAAGEYTGGTAGREPPSQVCLGDDTTATTDKNRSSSSDSRLVTASQADYGRSHRQVTGPDEISVAAGLPTPGLNRHEQRVPNGNKRTGGNGYGTTLWISEMNNDITVNSRLGHRTHDG